MNLQRHLDSLRDIGGHGYPADRIIAELDFLAQLVSKKDEKKVAGAVEALVASAREARAVTIGAVEDCERALAPFAASCKGYGLICAGHAHIDMNWMWGFQETTLITIDTFRTVLALMERYPFFHFSQSQASTYRIVEQYAPQLMEPIRKRIAEGRWEVTASQWVEADDNLPSGESLARQLLYARRYLKDKFAVQESAFDFVFLPDTFGHNANAPEILADAGVKYLYHCRGSDDFHAYRWEAALGRSIAVYREPRWYNTEITPEIAGFLPSYAAQTGLKTALCVYGVGDHGGGPTMRDIEMLDEMSRWPLFPSISFGTMKSFFKTIEPAIATLPVVKSERNMTFTGCYTSQARIKMANRKSQEVLYEAELFSSLAGIAAGKAVEADAVKRNLREGWINTLFNQFHDILPGSGVQLTREHALGRFQDTMAASLAAISESLRRLAPAGNPEGYKPGASNVFLQGDSWGRSEGAGVGFGADRFHLPSVGRGSGSPRRFRVFNQLQWARSVEAELTVWDWRGDPADLVTLDAKGKVLDHQVIRNDKDPYWGHRFLKLLVALDLPAFGYGTVELVDEAGSAEKKRFFPYGTDPNLVEKPKRAILENDRVRIELDTVGTGIVSFVDKTSGVDLVAGKGETGLFQFIEEDATMMTAWIVGRYRKATPLSSHASVTDLKIGKDLLEQMIEYRLTLPCSGVGPASTLKVRLSLGRSSARLRYDVVCDWHEIGAPGRVPQLGYSLALATGAEKARYDIPFGTVERGPVDQDVPATSFAAALPGKAKTPIVQLTTDSKQGFRFNDGAISVTLLRSSVDPDPSPEVGRHEFSFVISVLPASAKPEASIHEALETFMAPRAVALPYQKEEEAGTVGFLAIEGKGVVVSAVKSPEPETWDGVPPGSAPGKEGLVARFYEADGKSSKVRIAFPPKVPGNPSILEARLLDLHERPVGAELAVGSDGSVSIPIGANALVSVALSISTSASKKK